MAKIILEFVTVEKVGNGFCTLVEEFQKQDGSRGKQFYKAWSKTPVNVGDTVHCQGLMSAKPAVDFATGLERKWTDRAGKEHTSVEVNVNDAVINVIGKAVSKENMPF